MKRLYRSRKDRVISGICGGIGEYFKVDPVIVRVIAVLLTFTGGIGVIAYIAGIFIIPERPLGEDEPVAENLPEKKAEEVETSIERSGSSNSGPVLFGLILVILGAFFLLRSIPFFSQYYWWIRDQMRVFFWPGILIGFGLFLILRNSRR